MRLQGFLKKWMIPAALGLAVIFGLFQNCSDVRLKRVEYLQYSSSKPSVDFCTEPAETMESNLKFIFVIDRSGSNKDRNDEVPGGLGTDVLGNRRFDAITRFLSSYPPNPYVHYTMLSFGDDAGDIDAPWTDQNSGFATNNSETTDNPFTNDRTQFYNFIQDQRNRTQAIDIGATNYLAALNAVRVVIETDVAREQRLRVIDPTMPTIATNYAVFWVSDGEPYVIQGGARVLQSSALIRSEVSNIVNNLKALYPDWIENVEFSTAYYYLNSTSAPDLSGYSYVQTAVDLLIDMAQVGRGQALIFGIEDQISFSQFPVPTRVARFELKELWVHNSNTVWETEFSDNGVPIGILKVDSDQDNLSDDLERRLGSNPDLYDTDGNGVGDGVEYFVNGQPCANAACAPALIDVVCRVYNQSGDDSSFNIRFGDQDGDFLNDCEEKLLKYDETDFDSNNDYVPDHFAWASRAPVVERLDLSVMNPDQDGPPSLEELLVNSPLQIHNDSVPGLVRMIRTGGIVPSDDPLRTCYSYQFDDLVMRRGQDRIRMYIMENTRAFRDLRIMKVAERQVRGEHVIFTPADFRVVRDIQ